MLFNSYEFLLAYLPAVLVGFFVIARYHYRAAAAWLAVASVIFYGWWSIKLVPLLLASIAFNFAMGRAISRAAGQPGSRRLLVIAIAANLVLLGVFKYADFFLSTFNHLSGATLPLAGIVLPLGISFFTFTQIAFLVDAHRGLAREYDPVHYSLFVSYFPHLIAGPVLHHRQMMPQFAWPETYRLSWENLAVGLTFFAIGLAKKVLIADSLAPTADGIFGAVGEGRTLMLLEAWIGVLAYTFQLYFDFSGYSDMAIGLARLFNVRLPLNFDSPYKAASIIDFWRRWHMTLSAFLREYLYYPLGGNRKGPYRRYLNVMVTMLLGGLWHGASWTFVAWGGLHGLFLVANHAWRALGLGMGRGFGWCLTFFAAAIAWVFFRSESFGDAGSMLLAMAGANGISLPAWFGQAGALFGGAQFWGIAPITGIGPREVLALAGAAVIALVLPNTQQLMFSRNPAWDSLKPARGWLHDSWSPGGVWGLGVSVLLALSILGLTRPSPFLYFQF